MAKEKVKNSKEREEAYELFKHMRGQYIIGQALYLAISKLKEVPKEKREILIYPLKLKIMTTETFINTYSDSNFEIDLIDENSYVIKKLIEKGIKIIDKNPIEDVGISNCIVRWDFSIEMRSWGVKTLSAYATNVELFLMVEYYDENEDIEEIEVEVDLSEWEIDSDRDTDNGDVFQVQNVSFDFDDKKINVQF